MFEAAKIQSRQLFWFRSGLTYHLNEWTAEIQTKEAFLFVLQRCEASAD